VSVHVCEGMDNECPPTIPPQVKLTWAPRSVEKVRMYWHLPGYGADAYGYPGRSVATALVALIYRVIWQNGKDGWGPIHRPEPGVFAECMSTFTTMIMKNAKRVPPMALSLVPYLYTGRRFTIYMNAVESLFKKALTTRDSKVMAFVKVEKLPWKLLNGVWALVPRLIQPRNARYLVSLLRYIRPIEHSVYRSIDRLFMSPTVIKGYNAVDAAKIIAEKWFHRPGCVAIGCDASRWDQCVSKEALAYEADILAAFCAGSVVELRWLLDMQRRTRGTIKADDGVARYTTDGGRCSGDPNTALGNCLLMCGMMYSFLLELGLSPRRDYDLLNNGDDCVILCSRRHERIITAALSPWFHKMGFVMKIEPTVDVLERLEFCQTHPVQIAGQWRMVRNLSAATKDTLFNKPVPTDKAFQDLVHSVGMAGQALASGVPVFQEMYARMISNTPRGQVITDPTLHGGLFWWSAGMEAKYVEIDAGTRVSFWRAFGISPARQLAIEEHVRSMPWAGFESMRYGLPPEFDVPWLATPLDGC